MTTFVISLLVFGAAFAGMAIGPARGRAPGARQCGRCPEREDPDEGEGGAGCRR